VIIPLGVIEPNTPAVAFIVKLRGATLCELILEVLPPPPQEARPEIINITPNRMCLILLEATELVVDMVLSLHNYY